MSVPNLKRIAQAGAGSGRQAGVGLHTRGLAVERRLVQATAVRRSHSSCQCYLKSDRKVAPVMPLTLLLSLLAKYRSCSVARVLSAVTTCTGTSSFCS